MIRRVKVNGDNRITIPPDFRKELGIKPGDYLLVNVEDGYFFLTPESQDGLPHRRGPGGENSEGVDIQDYVNQERDACEDRTK